MGNIETFIAVCQQLIAEHKRGLLDLHTAAGKIYRQTQDHPFEAEAHPMLYKVGDLAFDIVEDYRGDDADDADWQIIQQTIERYAAGEWETTSWLLSAVYGEYDNGLLIHSYTVAVQRQNGETTIDTALAALKTAVTRVVQPLNQNQTDERYLRNLATLLPKDIGSYQLESVTVFEYLAEPYYSTAP